MKKIRIFLLLIGVLILTACSTNKKSINSTEFINMMESQGFEIVNVIDQFSGFNELKEANVALKDDSSYQIEFYVMDTNDSAVKLYEHNKDLFESSKGSVSAYTNVDLGNNNKYTLTTDGMFKLLSRIDNTMIYLDVNSEYKDEVLNIVKKLGY